MKNTTQTTDATDHAAANRKATSDALDAGNLAKAFASKTKYHIMAARTIPARKNAERAEAEADRAFWAAMAAVDAMKAIAKADGRRNAKPAAESAKRALDAAEEANTAADEAAFWLTEGV